MNKIETFKELINASLDGLIKEASKDNQPTNGSRNLRGPTLALSFRLDREDAERVDKICGYLGWTRTEFIRSAIYELLSVKEKMVKKEISGNLNKGE